MKKTSYFVNFFTILIFPFIKHLILQYFFCRNRWILDKNVTLEQLEAKGYINVTGCLDEENETISEFIDNAGNRRPAVLRLTSNENDDLCAKILLFDKDYNFIQMWTMYPNRQQAVAPGKCFPTDVVSSDKDGVVTVTLKNIQNPTVPTEEILQDEMLYKWKN